MQKHDRVIQLARESALFNFGTLIHAALNDAEQSVTLALAGMIVTVEQEAATLYRSREQEATTPFRMRARALQEAIGRGQTFLRQQGDSLKTRVEFAYGDYLERAMQTMYQNLRKDISSVSADDLSLIGDETVNQQLELDRLLARIRGADDEDLNKINIVIAQLHEDQDVKERENPFRPYLIARSVHQVLVDMVSDEATLKVLLEHLADALANHISEYYAAILTVFESSGIRAKLLARPGRLAAHQRYVGGASIESEGQGFGNSLAQGGLQPMVGIAPSGLNTVMSTNVVPDDTALSAELLDFVRRLFAQSKKGEYQHGVDYAAANELSGNVPDAESGKAPVASASAEVLSLLRQIQQQMAAAEKDEGSARSGEFVPSAVGQKVDDAATTHLERMTIDVVGMLFGYMLEDEQIPVEVRAQIGRLQIPFLIAAMASPELLQQPEHPVRRLLNRMSSAAVGMDLDSVVGQHLLEDITRTVKRILDEFVDDPSVFTECLAELELSIGERLRNTDDVIALSVQVVEQAEQTGEQLTATVKSLQSFLIPLEIDQRAVEFLCGPWARAMCREAFLSGSSFDGRFRKILPELIWSVEEKRELSECNAMIKCLPQLIGALKDGLLSIRLAERECRVVLDQFMAMHTDALRPVHAAASREPHSLELLEQYFGGFAVGQSCNPPEHWEQQGIFESDAPGRDAPGQDAPGQDAPGQDAPGQDAPGQEAPGQEAPGQDAPGPDAPVEEPAAEDVPMGELRICEEDPPTETGAGGADHSKEAERGGVPQFDTVAIETALAERGIASDLASQGRSMPALGADAEWLAHLHVGICVERWTVVGFLPARLSWISKRKTLYLFRHEQSAQPFVYSSDSLIKGMRAGSVRLVEQAPVFERAVAALLQRTEVRAGDRQTEHSDVSDWRVL